MATTSPPNNIPIARPAMSPEVYLVWDRASISFPHQLSIASSKDRVNDNNSIIIISLVEQLAAAYEKDNERRIQLTKCKKSI